MRTYILAGILTCSLALTTTPAHAKDLTLRQRVTTSGPRTDTHESMQYWSGNRFATDAPNLRTIIDLEAETMTVADKQKRTFFTQTFAEMRQQSESMQAELKKQMENVPPQAREMMAKMGMDPSAADAAVSLKPTGKSEKIAGYEAKEFAIEGGPMHGSVWTSEALQPPAGAKAGEAFAKMIGGGGPGTQFAKAMAQLKGLPLRTTMGGSMGPAGGFSTTTEAIEVSEKAPPADVMQVPEGFTKTDPPKLDAMHGPKGPHAPRVGAAVP